MKRLLHVTLRLKNSSTGEQIQNGRPTDEIPRDPITPPLFCPCFSLAETSMLKISLFFYEIKLLFTLLTLLSLGNLY